MASDLGQTSVRTEFRSDEGITRSIFVCSFLLFSLLNFLIAYKIVGAIHTMVHQRATHPPHVTADDRPAPF